MNRIRQIHAKRTTLLLAAVLLFASVFVFPKSASADTAAGTYELDGSLSCYVDAMGGIEFGGPLLTGVSLIVEDDGSEYLQLSLTKGSVEIYSVVADTFVDIDPSYVTDDRGITNGTLGIYDESGTLITDDVSYTLSDDTALNPNEEEVNYVDSITLPIDSERETYNLTMYINSNTMGVQFCNANDDATTTTYEAVLTVDWSGLDAAAADSGETDSDADGGTADDADAGDTSEDASDSDEEETELVADEEYPGLTIYEAGGEDDTEEAASEDSDSSGMSGVEKNAKAFAIVLVIAIVLVVIGLVLLYFARQKERRNRGALPGKAGKGKDSRQEEGKADEE